MTRRWWQDAVEFEDWSQERTRSGIPRWIVEAVLDRDRHQCKACGNKNEEELHPHHVMPRSDWRLRFKEEDFVHSVANLVTVCVRCHWQLHNGNLRVRRIDGNFYFSRYRDLRV